MLQSSVMEGLKTVSYNKSPALDPGNKCCTVQVVVNSNLYWDKLCSEHLS